ncbi:MAG: PstS family phosphate ABC transporter substrate-binding protein [Lautropia sp.]
MADRAGAGRHAAAPIAGARLAGMLLAGVLLAGCGVFGGSGGTGNAGERARDGLRDRAAGRSTPRSNAGDPVPGTLVPAPKLPPGERFARRRDGAPAAVAPTAAAVSAAPAAPAAAVVPAAPAAGAAAAAAIAGGDPQARALATSALFSEDGVYAIDLELPRYRPGTNLYGEVRTVGSSTLTNLFNRWSEEFERIQTRIQLRITGGGSAAAIRPFIAGESDLAPMAREMTAREIASFKERWGYEPTRLTVALDAIAIYVNKGNPLKTITLPQLDAIFGIEPKRGVAAPATWGDLGITGPLAGQPINRYGPRRSQGIYTVFRAQVLGGGDFTLALQSEPVSSSVVQSAGADDAGIAFASRLFATLRTRVLAVAERPGAEPYLPTSDHVTAGRYPLSRRLYVYVNKSPKDGIPLHVAEFLRYVCSFEGQSQLARDGGIALTRELGEQECAGRL